MRIFVAGATGVIGRRAVAQLVGAGHDVTAVARTPGRAAQLRAAGARPVEVSLFDPGALSRAVAGHDAVVNLATHIPPAHRAARASAWAENERIRREGSRNLADAAIAAGAAVYVQESIAFLYGEHGAQWVDAASTPIVDSPFSEAVRVAEANAARVTEAGGRGVVLRFGMFWAADSEHTGMFLAAARRGVLVDAVDPAGYAPMIDADDAAAAVVAALDAPPGVYDVTDDDPQPRREVAAALGRALGRRLRPMPARGMVRRSAPHLTWSQRVSNRRFRDATGWAPRAARGTDIVEKAVRDAGVEPALRRGVRLLSWQLALVGGTLGVYAQFFPRAFYDDFPFGREWVALDGPYNEHLVRDFGAMNLALTVLTFAALVGASRAVARAAGAAWLVFAVPHAVYHLRHIEHYDAVDQVANAVGVLALVWLAFLLVRAARPRPAREPAVPAPAEHGLVASPT
jgi:nucleoside-diphosphate-sugar epimerase